MDDTKIRVYEQGRQRRWGNHGRGCENRRALRQCAKYAIAVPATALSDSLYDNRCVIHCLVVNACSRQIILRGRFIAQRDG